MGYVEYCPTVHLRNIKTGEIIRVNAMEYATDLGSGRFKGFRIVSEQSAGLAAPIQVKDEAPKEEAKKEEVAPVAEAPVEPAPVQGKRGKK
jgi:hypothetical protein